MHNDPVLVMLIVIGILMCHPLDICSEMELKLNPLCTFQGQPQLQATSTLLLRCVERHHKSTKWDKLKQS